MQSYIPDDDASRPWVNHHKEQKEALTEPSPRLTGIMLYSLAILEWAFGIKGEGSSQDSESSKSTLDLQGEHNKTSTSHTKPRMPAQITKYKTAAVKAETRWFGPRAIPSEDHQLD